MGNFSRNTFNKLKHYVGVRLQQGVPIVDADWNEMEDIRRYELRAFLKWFVGTGVPAGNDGFHILAAVADNDFQIQGGNGSPGDVGRCLVDGWDVINESAVNYTGQVLFNNAALAESWDVDPLPPLTIPSDDRTDTVYLDVWEREVDSSEDSEQLVNPAIGIETCVRMKREWVVRVAENAASAPAAPDNHAHLELARLARSKDAAAIQTADITDLRLTGLKMISLKDVQQIMADAFGTDDYSLDQDGQPNLKVSLREAINAILRGGLPSTPITHLAIEPEVNAGFAAFEDRDGNFQVFWVFSESSPPETAEIRNISFNHASGIWSDPDTVTSNVSLQGLPVVTEDGNGDFWLFWTVEQDGNESILFNRYIRASNSWQDDTTLAETQGFDNDEPVAVADKAGDIWVFWLSDRDGRDLIYYSRFRRATGEWDPEELLSKSEVRDRNPFVLQDSNDNIWLFWSSEAAGLGSDIIWSLRFNRENDSWEDEPQQITTDFGENENPFALEDNTGKIWAFWVSDRSNTKNIWYKQYNHTTGEWDTEASQLTTGSQFDVEELFAFEDSNGDIWVFWYTSIQTESKIHYKRHSREGGWSSAVALATGPDNDLFPFALEDATGDVWVFWTQTPPFTGDFETFYNDWKVVYRKLIPSI